MLQADILIPRHGEERHLIRPDRVYGTGVLTAIPGFQPVINAQEVAERFTAIWPPMVSDLQRASGPRAAMQMQRAYSAGQPPGTQQVQTANTLSPGSGSMPSSTTVTTTTPGMSGFGAVRLTLGQRIRIWAASRALKKALAKRGLKGLGAAWNPHGLPSTYGQVPVVGGYEPLTPTMAQTAFALSIPTSQSVQNTPFPPVYQPSQAMAVHISSIAGQPAELSQQLVQQAIGGLVGQRASSTALNTFFSLNNNAPWGAYQ